MYKYTIILIIIIFEVKSYLKIINSPILKLFMKKVSSAFFDNFFVYLNVEKQ